jgi:8-oxo-dGTP diphosphatase
LEAKLTNYVVGFLFNESQDFVVLIRKNRPDWQKGKLNGVGGKIEEGEAAKAAMQREFFEETGVAINDWQEFGMMTGTDWAVSLFRAFNNQAYTAVTRTDEEIFLIKVRDIRVYKTVDNLSALIELALLPEGHPAYVTIKY